MFDVLLVRTEHIGYKQLTASACHSSIECFRAEKCKNRLFIRAEKCNFASIIRANKCKMERNVVSIDSDCHKQKILVIPSSLDNFADEPCFSYPHW